MKFIYRNYYSNLLEDPTTIWQYLSCTEKIAYYQLYNEYENIEDMFCNNTNIIFYELKNTIHVMSGNFDFSSRYYNVNKFDNVQKPGDFVCNLVTRDKIVGFNVNFDNIPNYNDYLNKMERTRHHYAMIVGYDDKDYWVADSPFLLHKKFMEKNHLTKISRELLEEEFAKQCSFVMIEKKDNLDKIHLDIDILIDNIISENISSGGKKQGNAIKYGKDALEKLFFLVKEKDTRLTSVNLFISPFPSAVISGRRTLLRRHLQRGIYYKNSYINNLIDVLTNCADMWLTISNQVLKGKINGNFYVPSIDFVMKLCELENRLYEEYVIFSEHVKI